MKANTIPSELRSDHLFLLIGTNPLPNWVAAKLLTNQGGCVHLVYTGAVKPQMERLKKILENDQQVRITVEHFPTAEANESQIFEDVRGQAAQLAKSGSVRVGLNYTGGTKMMSVHAHRALKAVFKDSLSSPILSYLDARTLRLKFDSRDDEPEIALATETQVSLETLLRLHDEYYDSQKLPYEQTAKYPRAARGLVEIHSNKSGQSSWRNWCWNKLKVRDLKRGKERSPVEYQKQIHRLDQVELLTEREFNQLVEADLNGRKDKSYSDSAIRKILQDVMTGYQSLFGGLQVSGGDTLQAIAKKNRDFRDSIEVARWLDGLWLEHYTFSQIESCRAQAKINQNGLAINLSAENREGREFEADVLAIRGYQLFYFSCFSGSDFKTAKLKLFEAMLRASQLGGDEAKFALVSCVDQQADLRRQVEANWQKSGQVEVFGRDSLPKLSDKLKEWFTPKS
jgi:hypothetical protein